MSGLKAFIMAGGKGTRLREITKDLLPKPMVMLKGKPLLQYAIESLRANGVDEVFISIGYMKDKIIEYFGEGERFGVKINYITEEEPLGSGGALFYVKDKMDSDFIVCNGDALFEIDIARMLEFHKKHNAIATLLTHPNSHPFDSDLIMTDKENRVLEINKKGTVRDFYYKNNVNAGFFIINPKALYYFDTLKNVSMENDFIRKLIEDGKSVYAYKSPEYIRDVGTPERYYSATKDIDNGLPMKKCLKNKQKAIFLDRDGVINEYVGYLRDEKQFKLIGDVADSLKRLNKSGYLAIVVSNQPVIARGECSFEMQDIIMNKMETLLGECGAFVDGVYYCPHHPHSGFEGEVKELKFDCECRKPKIGMLLKAVEDYNLDLSKCGIIGDTNVDIMTGKNAGIVQIRVPSTSVDEYIEPCTYVAENFTDAIDFVLEAERNE